MKLGIMRRNTMTKLEQAQASLEAAQQRLAALRAERQAVLGGDDIDALPKLSAAIAQQEAVIRDLGDRLVILTERQKQEEAEQRKREYAAGVDKIEAALSKRVDAAARVELVIKTLGAAVRHFDDVSSAIFRDWPPNVPHFFTSFSLNREGLANLIEAVCNSPTDINTGREWVEVIAGKPVLVTPGDFAAIERARHAELIADLRERGAPMPEPGPEEEPELEEPEAPAPRHLAGRFRPEPLDDPVAEQTTEPA